MIGDASRTLRAVLVDPAIAPDFPALAAAHIVFDRPDSLFSPQSPSTLDLFLFDLRENTELRNNDPLMERRGRDVVLTPPPRRLDCSYLVTAWPVDGPDLEVQEHVLLGEALRVLGRNPTVPAAFLQGSLVGQEPPLPLLAPRIDGLGSPAEFWSAMGMRLRAGFTVTLTVSVPVLPTFTGPAVTAIESDTAPAGAAAGDRLFQIGGQLRAPGALPGQLVPVPGGIVDWLDPADDSLRGRVVADATGRFVVDRITPGAQRLRASAQGFQALQRDVQVPGPDYQYEFDLVPN